MAHKKAWWSVKNLKDSQPKYRWVKVFGGQKVKAGNIIIRQNGSKYECGKNTYLAKDFTIHAKVAGVVVFSIKKIKRFDSRTYIKTIVNVLPEGQVILKKVAPKKEKVAVKKAIPVKKEVVKKEVPVKKEIVKKIVTIKKEVEKKKVMPKKPATLKKTTVEKKPAAPKKPAAKKTKAK